MATAPLQVILKRDVINLGRVGDIVKVKPGFARNFLYPKHFALPVSPANVAHFEHQKKIIEHQLKKLRVSSEQIKNALADIQITLKGKAGKEGKLFGSFGTRDIANELGKLDFKVDHRDVKLDAPIKTVGLHQVEVRLEADVKAKVNIVVVPEAVEEKVEVKAEDDEVSDEAESLAENDAVDAAADEVVAEEV